MRFNRKLERDQDLAWVKRGAFDANRRAKESEGQAREEFYWRKAAAINTLLKADRAFVDSVDWSSPDPTIGVTFIDGGRLHSKLSALDLLAYRAVRFQLTSDQTQYTQHIEIEQYNPTSAFDIITSDVFDISDSGLLDNRLRQA